MSIISVFHGCFCHHQEVVRQVAAECDAIVLDDQGLLQSTQDRFGIQAVLLERSLFHGERAGNALAFERRSNLAAVKSVLADKLVETQEQRLLCVGFLAHLLPRTVSHVLHVCLIAEFRYRVQQAMTALRISRDMAREHVAADDRIRTAWTEELLHKEPWDHSLYDLIIPMDRKSVPEAAASIATHLRKELLQPDPASHKALQDFRLKAAVELALAREGHCADALVDAGRVELIISRNVIMLSKLEEELRETTLAVPGVREVCTKLSPEFYQKNMYRKHEPEKRSKLLLVDDEREFVHTLSERLLMREIGSSVVYDGEQALAFVDEDEPDMMVLDLKMPGIDGLDVLRRVKAAHPHVQVIILTGHGSKEDERKCMEAGAFAYLQKPVDIDVLTRLLQQARVAGEQRSGNEC